ncbi:MAG: hypothetical protein LBT19_02365 [Candidatus Nomurabacteria bacterium]|jgi:hypothetical protein|nr:hypothetical protein [Candidatus Nomurabacteria bacterium]
MSTYPYWQKQTKAAPLFQGIDTNRPEQKQFAGHLLIIGGHSGSFFSVANITTKALEQGIGTVRTILPDSLKTRIPPTPETIFVPSAASGSIGKIALPHLLAASDQADFILVIGDLGKNAETATTLTEFLKITNQPTLITRDAIDLVTTDITAWIDRSNLTILATLPQLQKLFRTIYYPKVITLSMPMNQLVETLHKFTLSYQPTILTYYQNQIIVAKSGNIITTELSTTPYTPITVWNGDLATRIARLSIWNPASPVLEIIAAALI